MFCAQGEQTEEGIFKGSCKGDSGGPLQTYNPNNQDRQTLIGIVSGGIGCGRGIPGWYTKVAFYSKWVQCIVETSRTITKKVDVEKACVDATIQPKRCQEIESEDLIFGDLRSAEDDICNADGTFATDT